MAEDGLGLPGIAALSVGARVPPEPQRDEGRVGLGVPDHEDRTHQLGGLNHEGQARAHRWFSAQVPPMWAPIALIASLRSA